jgi:hypothetical protein
MGRRRRPSEQERPAERRAGRERGVPRRHHRLVAVTERHRAHAYAVRDELAQPEVVTIRWSSVRNIPLPNAPGEIAAFLLTSALTCGDVFRCHPDND